jgi:competence protein ComEC
MAESGRALSKAKGSGFVAGVWLENDGDDSFQDQAAARWVGSSKAMALGKGVIHAASGKRGLKSFTGCNANDIAVFSEVFEGKADCDVFDIKRLRKTGSIALFLDETGAIKIITARSVAGRRYWNDRGLRKDRLGY